MQWLTCRLSKSQSTISLSLTWQKLTNLTNKTFTKFLIWGHFWWGQVPFSRRPPWEHDQRLELPLCPCSSPFELSRHLKYQRNPRGLNVLYTIRTDLVVFDEAFVKPGEEFRLCWQDVQQKKHLRERNQSELTVQFISVKPFGELRSPGVCAILLFWRQR